jgi:hypothetical protein
MVAENSVIEVETMSSFLAVEIIENGYHYHDNDDIVAAYQFLIDNGIIWILQGTYGRMAVRLIEDGLCTCSDTIPEPTMDTFPA